MEIKVEIFLSAILSFQSIISFSRNMSDV